MKIQVLSHETCEVRQDENFRQIRLIHSSTGGLPEPETARVAVVGLGYVGLPLVCGFSRNSRAIGFDVNTTKIAELNAGNDTTGEVTSEELKSADASFSTDPASLADADVVLVCVPTPVDGRNRPDYSPLLKASRTIGRHMKKGAVIVFESTVDPGTTEEKCLPILEEESGMTEGRDFYLGYSPERINPADPTRKLQDIKKIVAGSTPKVTEFLQKLYARVVQAGLFPASSIKVAEAAKILENTQRDINIALMNELMPLYDKMGIRASDVIAAAGSKWNFHPYRPGMVGGHCIAVDPYYLVDAGRRLGLPMELVAAGRSVNEKTPFFLAEKLEELLVFYNKGMMGKRILVLGRSFKENCPDTRNSKTFKLMDYLWAQGCDVFNFDPVADDGHFEGGRGTVMIDNPFDHGPFDAIIVTLAHDAFAKHLPASRLHRLAPATAPLLDMRGIYDTPEIGRHFTYWRP